MLKRLSLLVFVAGCLAGIPGCGNLDEPGWEETEGYGVKLLESDIQGTLSGQNLSVSFALKRLASKGNLQGTLKVDLLALGKEAVVSQGSSPFTLDAASKTVTVALSAPAVKSLGDLGGYVIYYRVELPDGTLRGWRSLFMTVSRSGLVVVGNNRFAVGEQGILRIKVVDPRSGAGIADSSVSVVFRADSTTKDRTLAAGKTDKLGEYAAKFSFSSAEKGGGNIKVEAGNHQSSHSVLIEEQRQVLLTTDKPLYQPGQTVFIRALAMKQPRVVPVSSEKLLIEVEDSEGNKIFKKDTSTDAYGIASLRFTLARLLNLGEYQVRVTMGTSVRVKKFKVDRYTLPKFKVDVTIDRSFYKPGETVSGRVQVDYFFGKPVQGGDIKLTALASGSTKPIKEVLGKTDSSGAYAFSIASPTHGNSMLLLAEVVDSSGAKATGKASVVLTNGQEVLQVVADQQVVSSGGTVNFFLMLTDPTGKPISGTVGIKGLTQGVINVPASGVATHKVQLGPCAKRTNYSFHFSHGTAYKNALLICDPAAQVLALSLDKALYSQGQTAKVSIQAPPGATTAILDVVRQNATMHTQAVKLVGGKGLVDLKLGNDLKRTLIIKAHCDTGDRLLSDQRLIYVAAEDQLSVKVATDKAQYRPGTQAKVSLQLTDSKGKPAPGAMGVQVVDEALYALTDFKPGLERSFFLLEQEVIDASNNLKFVSPSLLFSASPSADDQIKASMLFAAAGQHATYPINHNSAKLDAHAALVASRAGIQAFMNTLQDLYNQKWGSSYGWGKSEEEQRRQWVEQKLEGRLDDFGVPYKWDFSYYSLTVNSAGMDEMWGTADDLTVYSYIGAMPHYDAAMARDSGGWAPDAGSMPDSSSADAGPPKGDGGSSATPIRQYFPETLYVNPALITDNQGKASIDLSLADSITTWRLTSIAHTMSGQLGSTMAGITVFQEFFLDSLLPTHLLQDDEVEVPVAVYNYTGTAQAVTVTVKAEGWFDLLSSASQIVTVPAKSVTSAKFRIRAKKVGTFGFTATGISATDSDGLKRSVRVLPNGVRQEVVFSGVLKPGTISHVVSVPANAIAGATELFTKVFPGILAEVMEGLESIFRAPYGCFEQTSSATYPNVLVLQYLKDAGLTSPDVEKKALGYIDQGYQRLLKYEVSGSGGFSLYGAPPAKVRLTAFGLMEFNDMSKVRFVDPALIPRVQAYLASKQDVSGAFLPNSTSCYGASSGGANSPVFTTAYVIWALTRSGYSGPALTKALTFLKSEIPKETNTYIQAVAANALLEISATDPTAMSLLAKLKAKAQVSGSTAYWTSTGCSGFYGYGQSMNVETTAMVVTALLLAKDQGGLVNKALLHLTGSKSGSGGWGTTQATLQALRALLMALSAQSGNQASGTIAVSHNNKPFSSVTVTAATSDVMRLFDLKQAVVSGDNKVAIDFTGKGELAYQVVGVYYLPHSAATSTGPLSFSVAYDRTSLKVGESIKVTAQAANTGTGAIPTVLMKIGVPPGFAVDTAQLSPSKTNNVVLNVEEDGPHVVLYLGGVSKPQSVSFAMKAGLPVKAKAPPSVAYPYYTPEYIQVVETPLVTVSGQ